MSIYLIEFDLLFDSGDHACSLPCDRPPQYHTVLVWFWAVSDRSYPVFKICDRVLSEVDRLNAIALLPEVYASMLFLRQPPLV